MFPNLCAAYSSLICLAYTCIMLNIWCKEKYSIYQTLYMNISRIQCPFGDTVYWQTIYHIKCKDIMYEHEEILFSYSLTECGTCISGTFISTGCVR